MSVKAKATCDRGFLKDGFSRRKERLAPWQQVIGKGEVYRVCSEDKARLKAALVGGWVGRWETMGRRHFAMDILDAL